MNGEVYLHLHINIADSKYNVYGGHLNYAYVSATCEIVIEAVEGEVEREFSEGIGLNLYKL
jgi:predicted DNA-binding protein with PD1-like motif